MSYLVVFGPGQAWWPDRPTQDQGEPIERHCLTMRRLAGDGLLLAGGTLADCGAVAMLATDDEKLARAVVDADPAVTRRVLRARILKVADYRRGVT
ncbi:MAG TPA: hypothetical protein VMI11_06485 [Actinomycetes bacterium]|nr:hypothetical protein [Actinomycetes bacterium]